MSEVRVAEESRLQQKEKKRVYALARELDVDLKDILQYCKDLGYDVKNQLSSLDPDQCDTLVERVKRGNKPSGAVAAAPAAPRPVITNQSLDSLNKVRTLPTARKKVELEPAAEQIAPPPAPPIMEPVAEMQIEPVALPPALPTPTPPVIASPAAQATPVPPATTPPPARPV